MSTAAPVTPITIAITFNDLCGSVVVNWPGEVSDGRLAAVRDGGGEREGCVRGRNVRDRVWSFGGDEVLLSIEMELGSA